MNKLYCQIIWTFMVSKIRLMYSPMEFTDELEGENDCSNDIVNE